MRSSASFIVLIVVAFFVIVGLLISQGDHDAVATGDEMPAAVATTSGGAGATAATDPGASTPDSRVGEAAATDPVELARRTPAGDGEPQEWVTMPGTGIGLWPKPQSK